MAISMASLRLGSAMAALGMAVPRASLQYHARHLQLLKRTPLLAHPSRYASSERPAPPKPRVLEKPDKFRPPSHPSRIRQKTRYSYGPELTQAQKTKRYPHMMPPEGTFMHWFLTNRTIHLWISLSILISLVVGIWLSDFLHNTPYKDMLPPNSMFFAHPFSFIGRWIEVYDLHVAYVSAQTAEKRKQKVDDVKKRSAYRKAHGLDQEEGIFGGWTAKSDEDAKGPALVGSPQVESEIAAETTIEHAASKPKGTAETYIDFDGKEQPVQKRWFGIF
ncbi:hypothetical protein HII31_11359 [Pseudocercospora fuligena]|uniref:Uncharacterized protein n=1 Tax=Pseudocercospora fuligena TaxID=685502 RepID=A0A8H6R9Z0_9PEZI|nr:hypothetical protein HII31_11359 [Pseudocercospora fuligena]